jgi:hypothetical protein
LNGIEEKAQRLVVEQLRVSYAMRDEEQSGKQKQVWNEMRFRKRWAKELRDFRRQFYYLQKELAALMEVSVSCISNGERLIDCPSPETFLKFQQVKKEEAAKWSKISKSSSTGSQESS